MERPISGGASTEHPALARFLIGADEFTRLLLIKAAARTGRKWFARSWIGDRRGEVHDLSASIDQGSTELEALIQRLHDDEQLRLAVILPPSFSDWDRVSRTSVLVAFHRDLLLEPEELEIILRHNETPNSYSADQIRAFCGGWLDPATSLIHDPHSYNQAQRILGDSLLHWLAYQDPRGTLSEAAFLPKLDEATVEAYFGEISSTVHTLDELLNAAMVQPDGHGGWMMPLMVQRTLLGATQRLVPERVEILERAALNALATTHGVHAAADSAVEKRRWDGLLELLTKNWTDLFFTSPQKLGAIAVKVPRFITDKTMYLQLAVRMLAFTGKDGMELQLPALAPDYSADRTAQRLYLDTEKLYRNPDARALTVGMLELFHLRIVGLFREEGASALRLRRALSRALEDHHFNLGLVAFAELQAGISLQLAGNEPEARFAYENAFHWAKQSGKALLLADSAGKLALLHALDGNTAAARHWLAKHDSVFEHLRWGRKSIAHTGSLARGFIAISEVDLDVLGATVGSLPPFPDNEEFWSAHAYLIAMQRIIDRVPESARSFIEALRVERRYAACSPMAESLLGDAWVLATASEGAVNGSKIIATSADPALRAFALLLKGHPDAALSALNDNGKLPIGVRRRRNLAVYLDLVARNPEGPTPELQERIQRLHRASGNLAEIAMLRMVPGWSEPVDLLELKPEERRRLEKNRSPVTVPLSARPVLTPREREVLGHLRTGMTRREIAQSGYRSENTVKTQMRSLYRKLEASNVGEVLERARIWGL